MKRNLINSQFNEHKIDNMKKVYKMGEITEIRDEIKCIDYAVDVFDSKDAHRNDSVYTTMYSKDKELLKKTAFALIQILNK